MYKQHSHMQGQGTYPFVGEAVRLGRPLINKNTLLELRGATVPTQVASRGMLVTY
jgi:hypothetical protein